MSGRDEAERAAQRLAELILRRHRGHLRELRLRFVAGGVVLHGVATSPWGKQVALHEVVRGSSFPVVANLIEVQTPTDGPGPAEGPTPCPTTPGSCHPFAGTG